MSRTAKSYSILVTLGLVCLTGCDEDWAKRLEFGTRYPDARIEVTFSEPASPPGLYRRFEEAAHIGGFFSLRSGPISAEDVRNNDLPRTYYWFPDERSDYSDYRIGLILPRRVESPSSFTFVFYNASTDPFTEKEWRMFFRWKNDYLPKVFPDATLEVTQHPAEFTRDEDLSRISNNTGIEVPERYNVTGSL